MSAFTLAVQVQLKPWAKQ